MRVAVLTILALALSPAAVQAQDDPLVEDSLRCESWYQSRSQPGTEVVACDQAQLTAFGESGLTRAPRGGAELTGPGDSTGTGTPPNVYHDDDPTRLARVRVIGRGTATAVFVTRFDRQGLLMEALLGPVTLPDGVHLTVALAPEGAVLERADTGEDLASAPTEVTRLERATWTPLSARAVEPVAAACLRYRRDGSRLDLSVYRARGYARTLTALRRYRARLAGRLRRAVHTRADAAALRPFIRMLLAGDRHLRSAARAVRDSGDPRRSRRSMRAFYRSSRDEPRLRRRLGLSECSA